MEKHESYVLNFDMRTINDNYGYGGETERGKEGGGWGLGVCHTLWGQDMIARGTLPNHCNQCNWLIVPSMNPQQ